MPNTVAEIVVETLSSPEVRRAVCLRASGITKRSGDEKYSVLVAFRETEEWSVRLAMLGDRLGVEKMDSLARLIFRWGLCSAEAALKAGLFEGVDLNA